LKVGDADIEAVEAALEDREDGRCWSETR